MISYKAFAPGLICRGYQFVMDLNCTDQANCGQNGFHSAENPLDCLSYYSLNNAEFFLVEPSGDIDEDQRDSKISSTQLRILKQLTKQELFLHGLAYMVDHPKRSWSSHVSKDRTKAQCGYAVVRGIDPIACGQIGDILAFAKESVLGDQIEQIALTCIDGVKVKPNTWYGVDLKERTGDTLA